MKTPQHAKGVTILVSTINDRIANVPSILHPQTDEIQYIVSYQYTDDQFLCMIPAELSHRTDVTILTSIEVGLSASRNYALSRCKTPIAILADDDSHYPLTLIHDIYNTFNSQPHLDIITFANNRLALRLSTRMPQFDTRFGIGSAHLACGEEEVLLHQAHKLGLNIVTLSNGLIPSTNERWSTMTYDKRVRRSWGALQYMRHSTLSAFLRIVFRALTMNIDHPDSPSSAASRSIRERWHAFRDMFDGLQYIITHPLNESVAEEIPLDFQPIDIWRMP